MKFITTIFFFLFTLTLSAQKIEQYLNYQGLPCPLATASYYSIVEPQNELWVWKNYYFFTKSLQMEGSYKDSQLNIRQGKFSYYYPTGNLERTGNYEDEKRSGLWLTYHPNGMLSDSATYKEGKIIGARMSWHPNGFTSDSAIYNPDGSSIRFEWFDNGLPSSAGYRNSEGKLHGKWQFFHKNGKLSAQETFDDGKLLFRQYFDENGSPLSDTTNKDRPALFAEKDHVWTNYLDRRLLWPANYTIVNTKRVAIVLIMVIDEEGNVEDVWVDVPFHPAFEKVALTTLKDSRRWKPAISHNRKIKYRISQTVVFVWGRR